MRDEYTELLEQQLAAQDELRQVGERLKTIEQAILKIRDGVVMAQSEQCPYCGVWLRTDASYWAMENRYEGLEREIETHPYESRKKYQIRLKLPESRGGEKVIDNLVACCNKCGPKKHQYTHDEYLRFSAQSRMVAEYNAKRIKEL